MISSDRKDLIDAPARALYFLGAFKYKVPYRKLGEIMTLAPEKYGLQPAKASDEAVGLTMLLEKVRNLRWKEGIKARLAQRGADNQANRRSRRYFSASPQRPVRNRSDFVSARAW